MNCRTGVSDDKRKQIDDLLRKYNFTPNYPSARASRIAVLVPCQYLGTYSFLAIRSIHEYAEQHGLGVNVVVRGSTQRETALEQIRDQQCAGVVVIMAENFAAEHAALNAAELPVVFLDSATPFERLGFIDNDSYSGAHAAARHLLELGHRRIGFLDYGNSALDHLRRFKGFENALREAGVEIAPHWRLRPEAPLGSVAPHRDGQQLLTRLLAQAPELTAVMAVDDKLAMGALAALHRAGRRVPAEFSVVGFDDLPEAAAGYPALTTVEHPVAEAARRAAQAIHECWQSPGTWQPPREILPTRLIVRESTGPAPAAV